MHDVVVIGGGHNGLVCALVLARTGRRVLVVERAEEVGGALRSAELTVPGLVHDVLATNVSAFRRGPAWDELGDVLSRHGATFASADAAYASAFPDRTALKAYAQRERTLSELAAHDPRDAEGWRELSALHDAVGPALTTGMATPMRPGPALAWAAGALRRLGRADARRLAQLMLASTRDLGELHLATREARSLVAAWGLHQDFGPDVAGGAMFPFVKAFGDLSAGMDLVRGGASGLTGALAAGVVEHGGEVATGATVDEVLVDRGRAHAVRLSTGDIVEAAEAVVAGTTPTALYGHLLRNAPVPRAVAAAARRYTYGPASMMVHLALRAPVPWAAGEALQQFAYVHLAPYVEDLAEAYTAARNGRIPGEPMLVVGQSTAVDPSRSHDGTHALWVMVRSLPQVIAGDALGQIEERTWAQAAQPVAERALRKLERHAPGTRDLIRDWHILGPTDIERANPNLVGGDSSSGSSHLRQNFAMRPLPGLADHTTPFAGLFTTGASTWPGAGVTGLPGLLAARRVMGRRRLPWRRHRNI